MIRLNKLSLVGLLCLLLTYQGWSQGLVLAPLGSEPKPIKPTHQQKSNRDFQDSISLPLVEDFSYTGTWPNQDLWKDFSARINGNLPLRPPTIGVATLDGLDGNGNPYAATAIQGEGDTLTSKPIRLALQPSDSVYLSFFYQPGGRGNFPEFVDSLMLEFYRVSDSTWNWVWGVKGEDYPQLERDFLQVMIPVRDTAYLKNGFQFRFRNYAQLNGSWDHWHIDYVRLDKNRFRNDTLLNDYAFMYPPTSILKTYQSLPLWHFLPQANENMDDFYNLSLTTVNQFPANRFYGYNYYNANMELVDFLSFENQGPIIPREEYILEEPVKYTYDDPGTEWTVYYLQHFLSDNTDNLSRNDTVVYTQVLSNYYALDDGTAENRISINNPGGGYAAQRFESIIGDTLKAVQFYLNRTIPNNISPTFYLIIWSAGANEPGEILHEQEVSYPSNEGMNLFNTIVLNTPIYLPSGTYYIGWAQTSSFEMNVGFDRNFDNSDRIYYNLDGNWYNYEAQSGTMMIRPLFRYPNDIYVGSQSVAARNEANWQLAPNPASKQVQILRNGDESAQWIMLDITGRTLATGNSNDAVCPISLDGLAEGVYLIGFKTVAQQGFTFRKLIISAPR